MSCAVAEWHSELAHSTTLSYSLSYLCLLGYPLLQVRRLLSKCVWPRTVRVLVIKQGGRQSGVGGEAAPHFVRRGGSAPHFFGQ